MSKKQAKEPKSKEYPIIDGHRKHFITYPVQLEVDKQYKWVGVRVVNEGKGGYIPPILQIDHLFDDEEKCQSACDKHNDWHFGIKTQEGKDYVNGIISESMQKSRDWDTKRETQKYAMETKMRAELPGLNLHLNYDNHTPIKYKGSHTLVDRLDGFRLHHKTLDPVQTESLRAWLQVNGFKFWKHGGSKADSTIILPIDI